MYSFMKPADVAKNGVLEQLEASGRSLNLLKSYGKFCARLCFPRENLHVIFDPKKVINEVDDVLKTCCQGYTNDDETVFIFEEVTGC